MVAVKKLDEIVKKWAEVTPGRAAYYEAGVKSPKYDWATATLQAEDAWQQGVQQAITEKRFGKGVKEAGTAKWQTKAIQVGVNRYAEGVRVAVEDYMKGFAPYHEVLSKVTLPPRRARGDPANIKRVEVIAKALHERKVKGGGA